MSVSELSFTLNGADARVTPRDDESLLETLRERCGIASTKDGCAPQGQCGCCLVLIDGQPKVSCATKSAKVAGKEITTLEGVSAEDRELVARAFVAAAGLQQQDAAARIFRQSIGQNAARRTTANDDEIV